MKFSGTLRFLRILASVVCLIACALLIRSWVWSYHTPIWTRFPGQSLTILSWQGMMTVNARQVRVGSAWKQTGLVNVSFGSLVLVAGTLAALPWVTWYRQFRLRAFLVVTTILAAALGIVVAGR